MTIYTPGVYAVFEPPSTRTIQGAGTSTTGFVGVAKKGPVNEAIKLRNFTEFESTFGGFFANPATSHAYLAFAVYQFFQNGGKTCYVVRLEDGTTAGELEIKHGNARVVKFTAKAAGAWVKDVLIQCSKSAKHPDDRINIQVMKRDPANPNSPLRASVLESYVDVELKKDELNAALAGSEIFTVEAGNTLGTTMQNADAIAALAGAAGQFHAFDEVEPNDGSVVSDVDATGDLDPKQGTYLTPAAFDKAEKPLRVLDDLAILAYPGFPTMAKSGQTFAKTEHGDCFFVADAPVDQDEAAIVTWRNDAANLDGNEQSALYYPWVKVKHPNTGQALDIPPSGPVTGLFARTDASRGVYKAPAGTEAVLNGAVGFSHVVSAGEQEDMNKIGVNAMRSFAGKGNLVWGARTLGDLGGPFRYVPVMRYFLYLRKSLVDGTQFAVFEPNDERLWTTLRMTAEAFMMREFRRGAFQGTTPEACFFVKCDSETNPQGEIDAGFVHLHVGYAPLKPAEFVMIHISHKSGASE